MTAEMIKYHKKTNTYITSKKSYFDEDMLFPGNLISGINTSFWGNVIVKGSAHIGKNTKICGNLTAENVILSSNASVHGQIFSSGDVSILTNARAASVICDGNLTIMDNSFVGFARSNKLVEIIGNPKVIEIDRVTKTVVRKDTLLPIPDEDILSDESDIELSESDNPLSKSESDISLNESES